jgi:hypothetical protein
MCFLFVSWVKLFYLCLFFFRHKSARENAKLAVKWAWEELERSTHNVDNLELLKTQKDFIDKVPFFYFKVASF